MLLVDRSGSIGKDLPYGNPENWNQVTSFLGNLVENLDLGANGAQVALVTFSEQYVQSIVVFRKKTTNSIVAKNKQHKYLT